MATGTALLLCVLCFIIGIGVGMLILVELALYDNRKREELQRANNSVNKHIDTQA